MKPYPALALLGTFALFGATAQAGDVEAGLAKADEVCMDCHGEDGLGDEDNPDIVKLSAKEFLTAMNEYKNGVRTKNAKMARAAKKLSDEDIANLAAYYETLR